MSAGETATTVEGMTAVLNASALHLYADPYAILAPAQPAMPGLVHCSAFRLGHGVLHMHCSTSMTSFAFINTIAKKMTRHTREPTNQVGVALHMQYQNRACNSQLRNRRICLATS